MPNSKIVKLKYKNYSGIKINCRFCDFTSPSETAIKLHRKVRHGFVGEIEGKPPIWFCSSCHNPEKKCNCPKH